MGILGFCCGIGGGGLQWMLRGEGLGGAGGAVERG